MKKVVGENNMLVSNIQSFSLYDGEGIRTVVFLKGCSIHCPWCANPENISFENQFYFNENNCVGELTSCIGGNKKNKKYCKEMAGKKYLIENTCPFRGVEPIAKSMTCQEIKKELLKDVNYMKENGGVTFSGGEPLLFIKEIEPLLQELKMCHIHICVETSLFVPKEYLKLAMKYVDFFYVDMKILDGSTCLSVLGGDIEVYMENLNYMDECNVLYGIRIPLAKPFVYNEKNIECIKKELADKRPKVIELIQLHSLAKEKYIKLGMNYKEIETVSNEEIEQLRKDFMSIQSNITILSI